MRERERERERDEIIIIHKFKGESQSLLVVDTYCRVTSFSPHLSRNRKWAQQAQYNRFVREWVKELG